MKALVVGGGIAGLATSLSLAKEGWNVTVLEQGENFREIGAGIQISPNGTKILEYLSVMPDLEPSLFEPLNLELRYGVSGKSIFKVPLKNYASQRWGGRYVHIHRYDLLKGLLSAVKRNPKIELKTKSKVIGYIDKVSSVELTLESGLRFSADLIVGADGIKSIIRSQMLGDKPPKFTGNIAWRALLPLNLLKENTPPPSACVWVGDGRHAVTTRIRSGKVVNFVGIVKKAEWTEESWVTKGDKDMALNDFSGWNEVVREIIEKSKDIYIWGLFERSGLAEQTESSIALVGDAAHPMLPSMAQGSVQALEDAVILSRCLNAQEDVRGAIKSFYSARRKRVSDIQERSKSNLKLFHSKLDYKGIFKYRALTLAARISPALIHSRQDSIYSYNSMHSSI
jgi:salicylate hydroxylase